MDIPRPAALISRAFAEWPSRIAIESDDRALTYGQIGKSSALWCSWLQHHGVAKGTCVAIDLADSLDCIECIIACVLLGAVYVPIDAAVPFARKQSMIAAAAIDIMVCDNDGAPADALHAHRCAPLPKDWQGRWVYADLALAADDPLTIMFTSGSTGAPKGVIFPQGGIAPLVLGTDTYLPLTISDRIVQVSARSFDAFIWELWGALLNGACLVLLPPRWSLAELGDALVARRISAAFLTARLFDTLIDTMPRALRGMRQIGFGGEAGSARHAARAFALLPGVTLINGYGPSENTTFSLSWTVAAPIDPDEPLPIGRPRGPDVAWLLDPDTRAVIEGAGQGELLVGGPGLALGYTDPVLTAERFVSDPALGRRVFRTGDLARRREDGNFQYLGRLDRQVKILGVRFNLFELEADLARHPDVTWTHSEYDVVYGRRDLVAFYTTVSGDPIEEQALKAHLSQGQMQQSPAILFCHIDQVPLKINGKADVPALIERIRATPAVVAQDDPLAQLWASFLPGVEITADTDFFDAGGDSLAALNLLLATEQRLGIKLPGDFLMSYRSFDAFKGAIGSGPAGEGALVILQAGEGGHVVVLVPWLDGSPYNFLYLLPHLPRAWRIVSIDFRQMRAQAKLRSVGEISRQLLDGVFALQASTISLVGPSIGGVIALDLAERLEQRGISVRAVVLLDSFLPNSVVRFRLKSQLREIASRAFWAARLRGLGRRAGASVAAPAISFNIMRPKAWRGFMPRLPATGRVVLMQATQENDITTNDRAVARREWLRRIPRLETQTIAGAHLTLLDETRSPALARSLAHILQA